MYIYVYIYIYTCIYIYIYMCIFIHIYVNIYTYMYVLKMHLLKMGIPSPTQRTHLIMGGTCSLAIRYVSTTMETLWQLNMAMEGPRKWRKFIEHWVGDYALPRLIVQNPCGEFPLLHPMMGHPVPLFSSPFGRYPFGTLLIKP